TFDLVFLLDRSGRFLYANPTTLRYLGKKESEVMGRKFQDFFPSWTRKEQKKFLDKVFLSGRPICRERELPFSGLMKTLETHAIPVKGPDGRVSAVLGVSRDITERKRMENMRLANKRLEMELAVCKAAQTVKKVPTLAHDVNNALTAINGYSALIYESLPSAHPLKGAVRRILRSVSRAYRMTAELQTVTLAEAPSGSGGGRPAVLERDL
ncbi:MAG TPA: PAS domain-containing protein, partial [Elusimicrobiales bacterium]|nr:PAS domain-containing protein [Elusimicrobiales bacterium]